MGDRRKQAKILRTFSNTCKKQNKLSEAEFAEC